MLSLDLSVHICKVSFAILPISSLVTLRLESAQRLGPRGVLCVNTDQRTIHSLSSFIQQLSITTMCQTRNMPAQALCDFSQSFSQGNSRPYRVTSTSTCSAHTQAGSESFS